MFLTLRANLVAVLSLVAPCVALGLASGCTSSDDPAPATTADAGDAAPSEAGSTLGDRCAASATVKTCATCCGHNDHVLDPYAKGYNACACAGPCKTACGDTVCAATPVAASAACDACLDAEDTVLACDLPGNDACDKDPACQAFLACDAVAMCLDKPDDADGGDGG